MTETATSEPTVLVTIEAGEGAQFTTKPINPVVKMKDEEGHDVIVTCDVTIDFNPINYDQKKSLEMGPQIKKAYLDGCRSMAMKYARALIVGNRVDELRNIDKDFYPGISSINPNKTVDRAAEAIAAMDYEARVAAMKKMLPKESDASIRAMIKRQT